MDFETIRSDYQILYDYICTTHGLVYYLTIDLRKYIEEYKQTHDEEIFIDNMLINLANLEDLYNRIDKIFVLTETITLLETKVPDEEKMHRFYSRLIYDG